MWQDTHHNQACMWQNTYPGPASSRHFGQLQFSLSHRCWLVSDVEEISRCLRGCSIGLLHPDRSQFGCRLRLRHCRVLAANQTRALAEMCKEGRCRSVQVLRVKCLRIATDTLLFYWQTNSWRCGNSFPGDHSRVMTHSLDLESTYVSNLFLRHLARQWHRQGLSEVTESCWRARGKSKSPTQCWQVDKT
jgi:hypothetical protein